MSLVLGLDIGTSRATGVLVDTAAGRVLARHILPYAPGFTISDRWPGGAEQDPKVWADAAMRVCRECILASQKRRMYIESVAVTGLFGGLGVPVDRDFEPLRSVPIWLDRRATAEAEALARDLPTDALRAVTGMDVIDPYFGFVKLVWYMARDTGLYLRTHRLLTPVGYIARLLTGEHTTDLSSMANFGGLLDARTWQVNAEMADILGRVASGIAGVKLEVRPDLFGTIVRSDEVVGEATGVGAALSGIPEGVPVVAGGVDTAVAMLAVGAAHPGDNALIMGTSWTWGLLRAGGPDARVLPRMVTVPHVVRPNDLDCSFGGGAYLGGAAGHWMPQMVASTQPDTLDREASMVPPGAGGLVFHPFLAGASGPIWRSDLTAAFVGLRADHHRGHMYRAVLEGAAFLLEDGMRYVNGAGVPLAPSTTVVDAGLGTALWRRIVADVVGRPLAHIAAFPGTAYGAAMLAAVGARLAREDDVLGWVPTMRTVNPTEDEAVRAAYVEARERFWRTMRALHGDVGGAPAKGGA